MSNDEILSQLLACWEEAREQGQSLSPEEVCRDHPHLLDELRKQVEVLKAFDETTLKKDLGTDSWADAVRWKHAAPAVPDV